MKQKFTHNHLIRFIYHETSGPETLAIQTALKTDERLFQKYDRLFQSFKLFPKVRFQPSNESISSILEYSRLTALEKQAWTITPPQQEKTPFRN